MEIDIKLASAVWRGIKITGKGIGEAWKCFDCVQPSSYAQPGIGDHYVFLGIIACELGASDARRSGRLAKIRASLVPLPVVKPEGQTDCRIPERHTKAEEASLSSLFPFCHQRNHREEPRLVQTAAFRG